jgi:hypothetical protein
LAIGNEALVFQVLEILLQAAPIFAVAKAVQILEGNDTKFPELN